MQQPTRATKATFVQALGNRHPSKDQPPGRYGYGILWVKDSKIGSTVREKWRGYVSMGRVAARYTSHLRQALPDDCAATFLAYLYAWKLCPWKPSRLSLMVASTGHGDSRFFSPDSGCGQSRFPDPEGWHPTVKNALGKVRGEGWALEFSVAWLIVVSQDLARALESTRESGAEIPLGGTQLTMILGMQCREPDSQLRHSGIPLERSSRVDALIGHGWSSEWSTNSTC
ncbi:hypothetical protein R1flu_022072 [Riccia fluitans]|uniref:Uncharacterized protein n=1 Tax=Riccia fluitans TaxID=41844 RepID=A0ABD1ZU94_9MARC